MTDIVCYCFGYSEDDIRKDYEENGKSSILERIKAEKKYGNCQCAKKNPTGKFIRSFWFLKFQIESGALFQFASPVANMADAGNRIDRIGKMPSFKHIVTFTRPISTNT